MPTREWPVSESRSTRPPACHYTGCGETLAANAHRVEDRAVTRPPDWNEMDDAYLEIFGVHPDVEPSARLREPQHLKPVGDNSSHPANRRVARAIHD